MYSVTQYGLVRSRYSFSNKHFLSASGKLGVANNTLFCKILTHLIQTNAS